MVQLTLCCEAFTITSPSIVHSPRTVCVMPGIRSSMREEPNHKTIGPAAPDYLAYHNRSPANHFTAYVLVFFINYQCCPKYYFVIYDTDISFRHCIRRRSRLSQRTLRICLRFQEVVPHALQVRQVRQTVSKYQEA